MKYSATEVINSRGAVPQLPTPKWEDVPFAEVPVRDGSRTLHMNIFAGQSGTKRPAVVYIYGGGWFYGDHTNTRNRNIFCKNLMKLVADGFVVAAVEYRKGVEAVFPAQLYDVKGAVRFLRANAETYGIDPNRIAAMGESAGGHLTALLALTGNRPDLEGETGGNLEHSSRIQAAVDIFGPSNLLTYADQFDSDVLGEDRPMQMPVSGRKPEEWDVYGPDAMLIGYDGPGRGIRKLMEIAAAENPDHPDWKYVERIQQASPMTYVHENCAPMLILHGMRDIMVPAEQSWQLYYELCKAGADVWFMTRNFATHGPSLGAECDDAMLDFLHKQLRDKYEKT